MSCDIFWGSHGCSLDIGHDGHHLCRSCCDSIAAEYDDPADHMYHHRVAEADQYGADGCAGTFPYYGRHNMAGQTEHGLTFFRYRAPDWRFEYLPDEFDRLAGMEI